MEVSLDVCRLSIGFPLTMFQLRTTVACRFATRSHCGISDNRVLGQIPPPGPLRHPLPGHHYHNQHVWRQGVR